MAQTPFVCDATLYQSINVGPDFILYEVDTTTGSFTEIANLTANGLTTGINSIGYNPLDNYIYGILPNTPYTLYRIDALGIVTNLGNITGDLALDPTTNEGGAFDINGNYYVTGGSQQLYRIDINTAQSTLIGTVGAYTADIAIDPASGLLYGWDAVNTQLFSIDPTDASIDYVGTPDPSYEIIGAFYYDRNNGIIAYGRDANGPVGQQNVLLSIDQNTGLATPLATGPSVTTNDGCSCVFTVEVDKLSSALVDLCNDNTITNTYTIFNFSGITLNAIQLVETLTNGLTYVGEPYDATPGINFLGTLSGTMSSNLSINNIPPGISTFSIDMEVPNDYSGPSVYSNLTSFANLDSNSTSLTSSVTTDNPDTVQINDVSSTQIVVSNSDFDNDGVPDCFDQDDDNDGILDTIEDSCSVNTVVSTASTWQPANLNVVSGVPVLVDAVNSEAAIIPFDGLYAGQLVYGIFFESGGFAVFDGTIYRSPSTSSGYDSIAQDFNFVDPILDPSIGGNLDPSLVLATLNLSGFGAETVPMLRWVGFVDTDGNGNYDAGLDQYLGVLDASGFSAVPSVNGELFIAFSDNVATDNFGTLEFLGCPDIDNDGFANSMDLDSDGDSCPDTVEAGHTDPDGDGILGNSAVIVDAQGLVIGQGGYTGTNSLVTTPFLNVLVTTQPSEQRTNVGGVVTYTTTFTGGSNIGLQWQESADNGMSWNPLVNGENYAGVNTHMLTVSNITPAMHGYDYRLQLLDSDNNCVPETLTLGANLFVRPDILISDAIAAEGNTLDFLITLSHEIEEAITWNFAYANITTSPQDYIAIVTGSVPLNTASTVIKVLAITDGILEPDETFLLSIVNPSYNVGDSSDTGTGTITNTNMPGTVEGLYIDDIVVNEESGLVDITIRTMGTFGAFDVTVATMEAIAVDNTALAGLDFTASNANISFPGGTDISQTFSVPILDDFIIEANEIFNTVLLSAPPFVPIIDNLAQVTIIDNDMPGLNDGLYIDDLQVNEGAGTAVVTVRLQGAFGTFTVDYATNDGAGSAAATDGGIDYNGANGTLSFAEGQTSVTFDVEIVDDCLIEGNEFFLADLLNGPDYVPVRDGSATITIIDNEMSITASDFEPEITIVCGEDIPEVPQFTFTGGSGEITVDFTEEIQASEAGTDDFLIVRTWNVIDACGNTAIFEQIIVVLQPTLEEVFLDICVEDQALDLVNFLPASFDTNGIFETDIQGTFLNGSFFAPAGLEEGEYLLQYSSTEGTCKYFVDFFVIVNRDCVECDVDANIIISKTVTANGDNINDVFSITGLEYCDYVHDVKIFNRWGAMVYEQDDYQNNWGGTAPDNAVGSSGTLPAGTYYYLIEVNSLGNRIETINGFIYLGTDQ